MSDLVTEIMLNSERGTSVFAMAETFAASQLVPQHLRGKPADCFIALTMAASLGQNPLMVMQNIVVVQGTPGWKAQYAIALANNSGLFKDRIDWKVERPGGFTEYKRKTKDGMVPARMENMRVTAFATLAGTGARVEFSVDTAMAIAEGWANNEKYTTMPEVMLRYRSGAFLVRFYAPDVMLGMQTADELETIPAESVTVTQRRKVDPLAVLRANSQAALPDHGDRGTVIDAEPERVTSDTTTTTDDEAP